jgi:hypothetical protein
VITPRETFKKSDQAKGWQNLTDSTQFQSAATAAMLQMQFDLGHPQDMGTAAAYQWQLQGAKRFLETLMSLTATVPESKPVPRQNLAHGL